jgi:23S rRNA pseudouridine2605 synthase
MHYIKIKERVIPVGRLDHDTSGLLLLTNDGDFANRIMHPRYEIKKTYLVEINNPITNAEIHAIEQGVLLDDGVTSPAKIKKLSPFELEISIHEGKKRVVRRMFKKLGYKVLYLQRIKVGKLELGELEECAFRNLSEEEKKKIFD